MNERFRTYQLVFQFQALTLQDFDRCMVLEESLIAALKDRALVDGHDFGAGEMNIFVYTDHPHTSFQIAQGLFGDVEFAAAYRLFEEEDFVILWPANLESFSIS